jgi:hypothetical protein
MEAAANHRRHGPRGQAIAPARGVEEIGYGMVKMKSKVQSPRYGERAFEAESGQLSHFRVILIVTGSESVALKSSVMLKRRSSTNNSYSLVSSP